MRSLLVVSLFLVACTASNPSFNAAISACVAASPSTWQDCERDLSVVPDLAPSCGRFIGDECCFAPPNLLVCDPGMECGATRRCEAVPDMAAPVVDFSITYGLPGAVCDGDSDCFPVDGALSVSCEKNSVALSHCCWKSEQGETCR